MKTQASSACVPPALFAKCFLLMFVLSPVLFTIPVLAQDSKFLFAAPPKVDSNRLYSVNTVTGEVSACQFQRTEGGIGNTRCFPAGRGAGGQQPGRYGLHTSNHQNEPGVFRVNRDTGEMSICFVRMDKVVCTAPAR